MKREDIQKLFEEETGEKALANGGPTWEYTVWLEHKVIFLLKQFVKIPIEEAKEWR